MLLWLVDQKKWNKDQFRDGSGGQPSCELQGRFFNDEES